MLFWKDCFVLWSQTSISHPHYCPTHPQKKKQLWVCQGYNADLKILTFYHFKNHYTLEYKLHKSSDSVLLFTSPQYLKQPPGTREAISKYLLNEWMNCSFYYQSVSAKLWVWKPIMELLTVFPSYIVAVSLNQQEEGDCSCMLCKEACTWKGVGFIQQQMT